MSESSALDSFLEKWRHRWPEWSVAETFVPADRRERTVAWFALQQEFADAMNIAGDPLPADAKLAWWGEELRSWQQQRSRHPLGRLLEPVNAPWAALSDALPGVIEARAHAVDDEATFSALRGYGEAVAAIDAALFGKTSAPMAVIAQFLAQRVSEGQGFVVGDADANDRPISRAAKTLLARWPSKLSGARERRMLDRFARGRLHALARSGEPAPLPSHLRLLLSAWNAARGA